MTMTAATSGSGGSMEKADRHDANERPRMGTVVCAVMVKELRQNWINLALVICLEFIIVCIAEWFRSGWIFDSAYNRAIRNVLLLPAVTSAITLGCGVAGLLLGILQPLADRNFELRAFLTHRPVPQWWLFLGRALAGFSLYLIAAGLPVGFALAIAPTRWGGHFFLLQDMLPPIADWIAGLAYYFAGLLIMERQARWYGSRALPILAVLAGSVLGMTVYSFWTAISISGVLILLYGAASLGSAVSHGFSMRAPRLTRWALIFVLFTGLTILVLAPTSAAMERVLTRRWEVAHAFYDRQSTQNLWTHDDSTEINADSSYSLTPDATIIKTTHVSQWNETLRHYEILSHTTTDISGHPAPEPSAQDMYEMRWRERYISLNQPELEPYRHTFRDAVYNISRSTAPIWNTKMENVWYWVPDRHIFYVYQQPNLSAYNPEEQPRIAKIYPEYLGSFGINGLQSQKTAQPFLNAAPRNPYHDGRTFLMSPNSLYQLDFEHIRLNPWFMTATDEIILHISSDHDESRNEPEPNLLIFTTTRIVCLDPAGQVIWALAHAHDSSILTLTVQDFPKLHERVLVYTRKLSAADRRGTEYTYEFYDYVGKLRDTKTFMSWHTADSIFSPTLLPKGVRLLHRTEYRAGAFAALGSPAVMAAAWGWALLRDGEYQMVKGLDYFGWRFWATALPIMAAYALGTWILAWIYARSISARSAWSAFAFLFGPAALLTFLATHRLPRWTRCPFCRRMRLLHDPLCPHCHSPWPTPPLTGTEIWTPITTTPH